MNLIWEAFYERKEKNLGYNSQIQSLFQISIFASFSILFFLLLYIYL